MLSITFKYIPFKTDVAFLQIKQTEVLTNKYYIYFFYMHVYSAIFALLAGFTQFNINFLEKYPRYHKLLGKVYVYIVLFFATPSGIYIGLYANGGLISKISFVLLGFFWFYFTVKGILSIKKKHLINHQKYMYRSFALAFSAITLRLWKVILVNLFHPYPIDLYQIIAWLGWIPNLILIEFFIFKKFKK